MAISEEKAWQYLEERRGNNWRKGVAISGGTLERRGNRYLHWRKVAQYLEKRCGDTWRKGVAILGKKSGNTWKKDVAIPGGKAWQYLEEGRGNN